MHAYSALITAENAILILHCASLATRDITKAWIAHNACRVQRDAWHALVRAWINALLVIWTMDTWELMERIVGI